jgi:hypothetical protein
MIESIANHYHQKDLFHGDIKPENIFIWDKNGDDIIKSTSDIGSLLYLGKPNENEGSKFIVTCYTEKYASA